MITSENIPAIAYFLFGWCFTVGVTLAVLVAVDVMLEKRHQRQQSKDVEDE
jgi:hypothetical protein